MKFRFFLLVLLCVLARKALCETHDKLSSQGVIENVVTSANDFISELIQLQQELLHPITDTVTNYISGVVQRQQALLNFVTETATNYISTAGQKSKNLLLNATRVTARYIDSATSKGLEFKLKGFMDMFRERMQYGFPEIGIPSLEPLLIEEFDITVDNPEIGNVTVYTWDAAIHKLSTFTLTSARLSLNGPSVSLNISVSEVLVTGQYNISGMLGDMYPLRGAGSFKITVYDAQVYVSFTYGYNNGLYIKKLHVDFSLGAIKIHLENFMGDNKMSEIMNQVFEEIALEIIEVLKPKYLAQIEDEVGMKINDTLKQLTIKDIINLLIGDSNADHLDKRDVAHNPIRLKLNL